MGVQTLIRPDSSLHPEPPLWSPLGLVELLAELSRNMQNGEVFEKERFGSEEYGWRDTPGVVFWDGQALLFQELLLQYWARQIYAMRIGSLPSRSQGLHDITQASGRLNWLTELRASWAEPWL